MSEQTDLGLAVLYAKLARIMGKVTRMQKTGVDKEQGYKFVQDADVLDAVRELLAEEKIAFFARITNVQQTEFGKTGKGLPILHTLATFEFTFACGDTGATVVNTWSGESLEWSDKGVNKAATAAEKFFLLKTFMISSGDEKPTKTKKQPTEQQAATIHDDLDFDTVEYSCSEVEVKLRSDGVHRILVYKLPDDQTAVAFTRDHAKDAGYDTEKWADPGKYSIIPPARVVAKQSPSNDYLNVIRIFKSATLPKAANE